MIVLSDHALLLDFCKRNSRHILAEWNYRDLAAVQVLTASLLRIDGKGVGVVGLAHLEGIERNWREDMEGK